MKVKVYNQKGEPVGEIKLVPGTFDSEMNKDLLHQAVITQTANARQVSAHTRGRGEVSGGGRKPWRQKGTGRARHGSTRSPIWRGGGVSFGPTKERIFKKKLNKKMRRKALLIALSDKVRANQMIVLDELVLESAKTREMAVLLKNLFRALDKKLKEKGQEILIISPKKDEKIIRASRNIPYTKTLGANSLNVLDLVGYKYILLSKEAVEKIITTFGIKNPNVKSMTNN